jgi:hypothetical protein
VYGDWRYEVTAQPWVASGYNPGRTEEKHENSESGLKKNMKIH